MSQGRPRVRLAPLGWAGASLALLSACAVPAPAPASTPDRAGAASSAGPASHPAPGTPSCNAQAVQDLVGQPGSLPLAEAARARAQAQRVRLIAHDQMVTKEYDAGRLNLQMDAAGRVVRIYCG